MGVGCSGEWDLFLYKNNVINSSHISEGWKGGTDVSPAQNQVSGPRDLGSACWMTLPGDKSHHLLCCQVSFPFSEKGGVRSK